VEKIAITGIGITSSLGNELETTRKKLLLGLGSIDTINFEHLNSKYSGFGSISAGLADFDLSKYMNEKDILRTSRSSHLSVFAAGEAIADSGINIDEFGSTRVGISLGIAEGNFHAVENELSKLDANGYRFELISNHLTTQMCANSASGDVSIQFGIKGPAYTVGGACSASSIAIIDATRRLRLGESDLMLAGGVSDCPRSFLVASGFRSHGVLHKETSGEAILGPFDANRTGMILGEGACFFTLERESDALERGAKVYGVITGYNVNSDARSRSRPDFQSQKKCIQDAIISAGVDFDSSILFSTHATGTVVGDQQEFDILSSILPEFKAGWMNNSKGFIGHTLGASGAIELAFNLPTFKDSKIHSCTGITKLDANCESEFLVSNHLIEDVEIDFIIKNTFGMFGVNSVLVVENPRNISGLI